MKISVRNSQKEVRFDLPWLKRFARTALNVCKQTVAIEGAALPQLEAVEVTIVSNDIIARVHRDFMQIDGPTDVITFDHGEILISAEMARDNAGRYGKTLEEELALYVVHGLLHLNGFTDERSRDAAQMRRAQNQILKTCLSSQF